MAASCSFAVRFVGARFFLKKLKTWNYRQNWKGTQNNVFWGGLVGIELTTSNYNLTLNKNVGVLTPREGQNPNRMRVSGSTTWALGLGLLNGMWIKNYFVWPLRARLPSASWVQGFSKKK